MASIPLLTLTPTTVNLSAANINVTSGNQLAIVLTRTAPHLANADVVWQDSGVAGYGGGSFFVGRIATVATPEPASLLLLGSGIVGVGARRWRNRKRQ